MNIVCKKPVLNLRQNSALGGYPQRHELVIYDANMNSAADEFIDIATKRCGLGASDAEDKGSFSTDFVRDFHTIV